MTTKVNENDLEWIEELHGERYGWRAKSLAERAGGERLGCTLYELPPGRRSWPYHYHTANEEAIYVVAGRGTLRLAGRELPLAAGDYVALPIGERGAHQVHNDSAEPLRYLCFSTMVEPEIAVYPDSGKVGLFAGSAPGTALGRTLTAFLARDADLDYWHGED